MSETTAVMMVPEPVSVVGMTQDNYDKQTTFRESLESNLPQIAAVLPKGVRASAIASAAMTAALDNPSLLDCSPLSMMRSVIKMASLGLRVGETCDLVPVKNKVECWVRVKGVVELAQRSGAIRWAREGYVCEGDDFEHEERGDGTHFRHRAVATPKDDASNLTHVYAVITLPDGQRVYEVWTKERLMAHKTRYYKKSSSGRPSPWDTHPLTMFAKTVVKAALRFAPLSPEMRNVMAEGDEITEGSFEIMGPSDPQKALAAISGTMGALDAMEQATPTVLTLADAEAMVLPGQPGAWGGKAGMALGTLKDKMLTSVVSWIGGDDERRVKFADLGTACEIILAARQDDAHTDALVGVES